MVAPSTAVVLPRSSLNARTMDGSDGRRFVPDPCDALGVPEDCGDAFSILVSSRAGGGPSGSTLGMDAIEDGSVHSEAFVSEL